MAVNSTFLPNDDTQNYPFCRLQLVVETFWHWTVVTNQSKLNISAKGCKTNG